MEFDVNMTTPDGKKMMYLIGIGVKEDCENYDAIWAELERRMNAVSIPIVRVDWPLTDGQGYTEDCSDCLFYAQTFETGMGFITGILKDKQIRSDLEFCNFFNGDGYKNDPKKYSQEDTILAAKEFIAKHHPSEEW